MEDWVRAVHAAREVLTAPPARMPDSAGPVRAVVYASWRRSRLQGLAPNTVCPGHDAEPELDGYLMRAVAPLVERRLGALEQASSALSLTDGEGCLLQRWVSDRAFADRLDRLNVVPGFSVAEQYVGTTSAVSLLSGTPLIVRGPEHFSEHFSELTCAGAPIVHPVTRRIVGSLDVTCRLSDSSPFALSWVMELAADVQEALRDRATRQQRMLLDAHLSHHRGTGHALVTLDRSTIISTAAAARMLGGLDQARLWEHASCVMADGVGGARPVALGDGSEVMVVTHPVHDGPEVVGAVMSLRAQPRSTARSTPRPTACLPGLVGRSARWTAFCASAHRTGAASRVLVTGEPGSGRLAVTAALAPQGPLRVLDGADARDPEQWLAAVESEIDGPDETLVLRHVDRLGPHLAQATHAALRRRPSDRTVFATSEVGSSTPGGGHALLDTFVEVLEVPPLRERLDDLPMLLTALGARAARGDDVVHWMPDAVQALGRLSWPGNVAALEAMVRGTVARRSSGYIGASDLPPDLVARSTHRPLARLEQAEADTIMRALRDADGNKHRAAESLGIARSTLYRKVRALGLDLSTATF